MLAPDDVLYSSDHEWLRYDEADGLAVIGITDFAQGELGDIVYVDLEPVGTELSEGVVFGTVEAVKTVSDLFSPVAGVLVELNEALSGGPEIVNNDPYGGGWMVKVKVAEDGLPASLMSAADYTAMVGRTE